MNYREPLFSVHGTEERVAIYLEERDAVLALIEETGNEVDPDYIADLCHYGKIENFHTKEGLNRFFNHRDKLDATAILIATMSPDEALTLVEQILITIRAMKTPTIPRLEIVK